MNKMNINIAFSDTTDVKDIKTAIKGLTNHYNYNSHPDVYSEYSGFAMDKRSYQDKNALILESIEEEIIDTLGLKKDKMLSYAPKLGIYNDDMAKKLFLSIVTTTLDEMITTSGYEQIFPFAEFRNLALGDSNLFEIGGKGVIKFARSTHGKTNTIVSSNYSENVPLTPEPYDATVKVDFYQIASGRMDLGRLISKIMGGQTLLIAEQVFDIVMDNTNGKENLNYLAAFTQVTFQEAMEDVQALNGVTSMTIFGLPSALAPILPTIADLKQGLGEELMKKGFIGTAFGYPVVALSQLAKTGWDKSTANRVISTDHVVCISTSTDKLMKVVLEGETRAVRSTDGAGGEDAQCYTLKFNLKVGMVSQSHYVLIKTK